MASASQKSTKLAKGTPIPAWFLLLLAFFEGAAVMACELIGARLAAPYFGSSINVWAAVLGVTLTALMCGYYAGGYLSEKLRHRAMIFYILAVAGGLLIIMPMASQWVMSATIGMPVRSGVTLSLVCYLFPPLFFMGLSSPIIIHLLNERAETSGKTAGSVYAVSTLGGILSTFLLGFYLMPWLGLRVPAFGFGALLVGWCAIGLLLHRRRMASAGLALLLALGTLTLHGHGIATGHATTVVAIYEGILGQIKVVDLERKDAAGIPLRTRILFVNNITQTVMNLDRPDESMSEYIFAFAAALSSYPPGSRALVLGLGGGALVRRFDHFKFQTDIVELDTRIRDVAMRHFGIDSRRPVLIDDARHFLNQTQETYDIIALDLFASETPPSDVLSLEGLREAYKCLRPEGVLAINFTSWLHEPKGRIARSLIKTLQAAGFHVKALETPSGGNLLLLATKKERDFSAIDYLETDANLHMRNLERRFVDLSTLNFSDAVILDDNHARFETLYSDVAMDWRGAARQLIQNTFTDYDLQMMK